MAGSTLIVNIGEMIDLAIGTPEVGVVDFNMLQAVLHCIAQQMRILYKNVELRGSLTDVPQPTRPKDLQTVAINEFVVTTQDSHAPSPHSGSAVAYKEASAYPPASYDESILVVERVKKTDAPISPPSPPRVLPGAPGAPATLSRPGTSVAPGVSGVPGAYGGPGRYETPGKAGIHSVPDEELTEGVAGTQARYDAEIMPGEQGIHSVAGAPGTHTEEISDAQAGVPGVDGYGPPGGTYPYGSVGPEGAPGAIAPGGVPAPWSNQGPPGSPGPPGPPGPPGHGAGVGGAPVFVPPTRRLSIVTLSKFNVLESTVVDLQKRVYGSIPKNEEILEEVRSQTNLKSITDMWTSLNVSTRLEAAEEAIMKLSSLVNDLINDTTELQRRTSQTSGAESVKTSPATMGGKGKTAGFAAGPSSGGAATSDGNLAPTPAGTAGNTVLSHGGGAPLSGGAVGTTVPYGGARVNIGVMTPSVAPGSSPRYEDLLEIYDQLNRMQYDIDVVANTLYAAMDDLGIQVPEGMGSKGYVEEGDEVQGETRGGNRGGQIGTRGGIRRDSQRVTGVSRETEDTIEEGTEVQGARQDRTASGTQIEVQSKTEGRVPVGGHGTGTEVEDLGAGGGRTAGAESRPSPIRGTIVPGAGRFDTQITNKINDFDKRLKDCYDNVTKNYNYLLDQIKIVGDKVELMKHAPTLGAEPTADKLSPQLVKDLQGLMQLFKTVQDMQEELTKVNETARNLAAEKEDRQQHIDALLEQIEMLRTCKMDREDIAEVMAEKADQRALARKVSHDQFEIACDDLARGLEQAIAKLNQQEAVWQQALDDIQREIESKLDKMELSPVKDFFNNKLKQLQENLKQMALLRREAEAAGTKRRLLRDVNCISCDAQAVMSMDPPITLPSSKPMPASMSMKPYLSYELDIIRKSQATNLIQRNMHDWETIDKAMAHPKALNKVRSETDKHICNRYCGGSHTVTSRVQRVARLGHFVKQWGPDVMPLSSGMAAGDDGKMYKVTKAEAASATAGGAADAISAPKLPKKTESARTPQAKHSECRCLEDPPQGKQQGK